MSRHQPSALIRCCLDYRYLKATQQFVTHRLGLTTYGFKTDAGGVKALVDGNGWVRSWILQNVRLVCQRHGVRTAARDIQSSARA